MGFRSQVGHTSIGPFFNNILIYIQDELTMTIAQYIIDILVNLHTSYIDHSTFIKSLESITAMWLTLALSLSYSCQFVMSIAC